jgi:hypothetical protein
VGAATAQLGAAAAIDSAGAAKGGAKDKAAAAVALKPPGDKVKAPTTKAAAKAAAKRAAEVAEAVASTQSLWEEGDAVVDLTAELAQFKTACRSAVGCAVGLLFKEDTNSQVLSDPTTAPQNQTPRSSESIQSQIALAVPRARLIVEGAKQLQGSRNPLLVTLTSESMLAAFLELAATRRGPAQGAEEAPQAAGAHRRCDAGRRGRRQRRCVSLCPPRTVPTVISLTVSHCLSPAHRLSHCVSFTVSLSLYLSAHTSLTASSLSHCARRRGGLRGADRGGNPPHLPTFIGRRSPALPGRRRPGVRRVHPGLASCRAAHAVPPGPY